MLTVHLQQLQFHAYHGVYKEEAIAGNSYELNLSVTYPEKQQHFHDLKDVLNYEELYKIVQKRMQIPSPLLEEVAEGIIDAIHRQYSYVTEINISIYKLQAPIEGFQGKVGITLHRRF